MLSTWQDFKFGPIKKRLNLISSKSPDEPQFVFVPAVLKAFKIQDVAEFEANGEFEADGMIIDYMRDDKGTAYHPNRIPCRPGCVIDLVFEASKANAISLPPTIAPGSLVSLNESINQLSIKSIVSTDLDPSEPMKTTLSRSSTTHIHDQLKTLSAEVELANQTGQRLDAEAMQSLIRRHLEPPTHGDDVQHYLVQNVGMLVRDMDALKQQGNVIEQLARKMVEMQQQALDRLTLIQSRTEAILTQQLELAEYPIPRLFIVLPEEPAKYDPAKHEGYLVREPTEFFKKYGPFLLLMLELIKFGTNIAGHVVPTIASLKAVELFDPVKQTTQSVTAMIDYSLKCIDTQLAKAQAPSLGDFIDTDGPQTAMTQQYLANYLNNVEGLEGVELRQLGSFLKTSVEDNLLGNLYRMTTMDGHVKWVCCDHHRAGYLEAHTQKLHDVIQLAGGQFDEQLGKVEIKLNSEFTAAEFYDAITKAKGVLELSVELNWVKQYTDFVRLKDMVLTSNIRAIKVNLTNTIDRKMDLSLLAHRRYDPLVEIMQLPSIQSFEVSNVNSDFFKNIKQVPKNANLYDQAQIANFFGVEPLELVIGNKYGVVTGAVYGTQTQLDSDHPELEEQQD
ncbi:hypothetical protein BGX27_000265 [Mortierella sp. AM989]|nr:hypothetical protein BGX27_000265 [Mortierella sp. AM989]